MSELNPVCSKCVSTGKLTCCSCVPWVPLTIDDVNWICAILKCKPEEFCVAEERTEDETAFFEEWRLSSLPVINGRFYMLCMKKTGGSCMFLKKGKVNGCKLGSDRATICKLYPLWLDSKDNVVYEGDDFCFFIRDKVPIEKALPMLGETEETAKDYLYKIKQDWAENHDLHVKMLTRLLEAEK